MISAVNGRKRALLTKSALERHNKRCTAQSRLCVGNKKGKTELKAMCDFKKKKKIFFFFFVSRYLGHDTIHVSPAQVSRCIDASMHRYALSVDTTNFRLAAYLLVNSANIIYECLHTRVETTFFRLSAWCNWVTKQTLLFNCRSHTRKRCDYPLCGHALSDPTHDGAPYWQVCPTV